jgi:hypothetical protein
MILVCLSLDRLSWSVLETWEKKRQKTVGETARHITSSWQSTVYAVIQRQVRLYLHDHDQKVPGNKGPTATPTAAVVFALFTPVMLVQFAMDSTTSFQVHGVQGHHLIVCEAVGIDPAWYQGRATGQNPLPRATPP